MGLVYFIITNSSKNVKTKGLFKYLRNICIQSLTTFKLNFLEINITI